MLDLSPFAASYLLRVGRGVLETIVPGSSQVGCIAIRVSTENRSAVYSTIFVLFSFHESAIFRASLVTTRSHFNAGDNVQLIFICCLRVELCFQF
jgi:hypothetical protein